MKLRSMMFVGAAALTTAALATDVLTDKTLGWMRVDSTLPITAVGVPWTDVSDPTANVKVADLVKTDNLTDGDNLYVYNNGTWTFYTLSSGAWVAGTTANSSITATAGNPSEATIARGQALYLERQNPTTPGYFYVYGADGEAISSTTLTGATKYLVASPKATAFIPQASKISGATPKSRAAAGDQIVVPLEGGATRTYTYISGKWGYVNGSGVRVKEGDDGYLPIQLGTGFWYVTANAEKSITITW
jgi:hypothetical protein